MITCKKCLELISVYIDNDLDKSIIENLEKHLAQCKNCMAMLHTVEKTIFLSSRYYKNKSYKVPKRVSARLLYQVRIRYKKP